MTTLAECLDRAAAAAARVIDEPTLWTVGVTLAQHRGSPRVIGFSLGFHRPERGWFGKQRLSVCTVEVVLAPRSVRVVSSGRYGSPQLSHLYAIPGFEFPPPRLDPAVVRQALPPEALLEYLQRGRPGARLSQSELLVVLRRYAGRLAWYAVHEVGGWGVRTLILDALEGHVLHDNFDAEVRSMQGRMAD